MFSRVLLNSNFEKIENKVNDDLVHRQNGSAQMQQDLDMNNNSILNLGDPTGALGVATKSYVDTQDNAVLSAIQNIEASGTIRQESEEFVATQGQTVFTLTTTTFAGEDTLAVYVNGVRQSHSAYTTSSTNVITFSEALQDGDKVLFTVNESTSTTLTASQVAGLQVDTIADLLNVSPSTSTVVNVLNYHSGVEGGGGVFYWDANRDCGEHNGGTVIASTAQFPPDWLAGNQQLWFAPMTGTGCWVRQYDGAVNVKWFGAIGDCDASTTPGDANYSNPAGTDNHAAFQKAIDVATLLKTNIYIPVSQYWYKIHEDGLTVTCGITGESIKGSRLKFTDNGLNIRPSLDINSVTDAVFGNFSYDSSISEDPADWTNNYDNFTGRIGMRSMGSGGNQTFRNIVITNTFRAGLSFYGGATKAIIDNLIINRCRGSFGDGMYITGGKKKVKITNCKVYDVTRIGLVTDMADGSIIEDCVVENCTFEYAHDYSYLYGGTEFNSGVWLEQTARSIIKNCTAKNTNGRGFTVTTGSRALEIANYAECYSVIDSCVSEDTGAGFNVSSLGDIPANHRITNCTALNCADEDITGTAATNSSNHVFIENFYSEKSFAGSQSRVLGLKSSTNAKLFVVANNTKVKSDIDTAIFDFTNSTSGHISTYESEGEVNYTITNFKDDNGVVVNNKHGLQTGDWVIENVSNLHLNSLKANTLLLNNCVVNRAATGMSPISRFEANSCRFNSVVSLITNTRMLFDKCEFYVPQDSYVKINNYFASLNEPNKIICTFRDCNFYKDFTGSAPYCIQFSTKLNPNKTGLLLDNVVFYNTNTVGTGGYAVYFDNNVAHYLGTAYLDDTVEFFQKVYTANQATSTVITKVALQ
jgi:hypothetical protein